MRNTLSWPSVWPAGMLVALISVGCDRPPSGKSRHGGHGVLGPETSPVKPTMDEGWCGGHGVPESVCTRCNDSLVPTFKEAGDWCEEHNLPESQCTKCHPEVAARWAALNPTNKKADEEGKKGAEPA